jgi:hypothetical protein
MRVVSPEMTINLSFYAVVTKESLAAANFTIGLEFHQLARIEYTHSAGAIVQQPGKFVIVKCVGN